MTLTVGDRGYDSSGTILSVADLLARGAKFDFRYLSGSPGGWKDWSPGEIMAYSLAGLEVGAYWESGATRMLEGFGAGVADAQTAVAEEGNLGHTFARIVFADDENSDGANGQKMLYVDGLASVIPNRFEVYGSGGLLVAVAQRHGRTHGTHVSSWGNDGGNAGIRQEANFHSLPGSDDLTLLKTDTFGSVPVPVPEEEMKSQLVRATDDPTGAVFVFASGLFVMTWIPNGGELAVDEFAGTVTASLTDTQIHPCVRAQIANVPIIGPKPPGWESNPSAFG